MRCRGAVASVLAQPHLKLLNEQRKKAVYEKAVANGVPVDDEGNLLMEVDDNGVPLEPEGYEEGEAKDESMHQEEQTPEEMNDPIDEEAAEKDKFKALIKKKSIITVDGEKRWSKKKQFRSEIKEVFGGETRNYNGFRSFTLKKDTTGGLKMKRIVWLNGDVEDKNDELRRTKPRILSKSGKKGK